MDITLADHEYLKILHKLHNYYRQNKKSISGRNGSVTRFDLAVCKIIFRQFPIVTIKQTAIKKALTELEWFLSGDNKCPDSLLDWWEGQLNPEGRYIGGYTDMLSGSYNQIHAKIKGMREKPFGRRHVLSTWNSEICDNITILNENIKTPTPCHLSYVMFTCEGDYVDMLSVQRSGDILLGVPHNWVQHWALLEYICAHTGKKPRHLIWEGCDIHLYNEESHIKAVEAIISGTARVNTKTALLCDIKYEPAAEYDLSKDIAPFKAADFSYTKVVKPPYELPKIKLL